MRKDGMIGELADLCTRPDAVPRLDLPAFLAGKLGPALYHDLRQTGGLDRLPTDDQGALHDAYRANVLRNLIFENELHRILDALDGRRILHMPLKGALCLLQPLYPAPGLRVMSDLDILVQPDRQAEAVASLREIGYEARAGRGTVLPDAEFPMVRNGVVADLHWQLTRIRIRGNEERVWQRARPLPGLPASTLLPSALDQFYIRFLHDTIQDHHLHAVRLWQAYEAALLFRRFEAAAETESLCAQAERDGLSLVLGVYLAQIDRLFACITRQPPELQALLRQGAAEMRRCDALGPWPLALHFAVGRDLLLRLRTPFLGGYRRAFVQIMWRECTVGEPTDVVSPRLAARAVHLLRLCLLHLAQALWRRLRRERNRMSHERRSPEALTWLHVHRNPQHRADP